LAEDQYAPGGPQPSFDKQYVRDYLEQIRWNKQPPVPSLPGRGRHAHAHKYSRRIAVSPEGTRLMPLKDSSKD
jgi:phosphoribosylaminoimidazole-succinocarboxamide synthase